MLILSAHQEHREFIGGPQHSTYFFLIWWEAVVQSAVVADKGTRYRVRLGPYDNTDELNRVKGELAKRGFDAAVIKY